MRNKILLLLLFCIAFEFSYGSTGFGTFQSMGSSSQEENVLWKTLSFMAFYVSFIAAGGSILMYVFYPILRKEVLYKARAEIKKSIKNKIEESIDVEKNDELIKLNYEIKSGGKEL